MINNKRWLQLRKQVLDAHPLCERCESEGRVRTASEVHHIIPVEQASTAEGKRELMYDRHNLRALCHPCHVETHRELGKGTAKENKERNDKEVRTIIEKFFG